MKALNFHNFSEEPFVGVYDSVIHPEIAPGGSMFLEDFKAEHFAKHLIDREMNKMGVVTNNQSVRDELHAKCFPADDAVAPLEALQIEEKKKVAKKAKKVEEEFPDLDK